MPFRYVEVDGKRYRITKFGGVFVQITSTLGGAFERRIANSGPTYAKVRRAVEEQDKRA